MEDLHNTAHRTNSAANSSFKTIISIEQRLVNLSDQADHIAQGFAFFSALPQLLSSLLRGALATIGIVFLFSVLCKVNKTLAIYAAGACSSAYFLHLCGVYQWLGSLPNHVAGLHQHTWASIVTTLSSTQRAVGLVMLLWLGAYPVGCLNIYLGTIISTLVSRLLGSYWLRQYTNEGGIGLLPSIEIPAAISTSKPITHSLGFGDMRASSYSQSISSSAKA
jgi:hypothetical protein